MIIDVIFLLYFEYSRILTTVAFIFLRSKAIGVFQGQLKLVDVFEAMIPVATLSLIRLLFSSIGLFLLKDRLAADEPAHMGLAEVRRVRTTTILFLFPFA